MHHAPCTMHHTPCTIHHTPSTIRTTLRATKEVLSLGSSTKALRPTRLMQVGRSGVRHLCQDRGRNPRRRFSSPGLQRGCSIYLNLFRLLYLSGSILSQSRCSIFLSVCFASLNCLILSQSFGAQHMGEISLVLAAKQSVSYRTLGFST